MDERVRREVVRLARRGQAHPDPAVAREAVAWARRGRRRWRFTFVLALLPNLLINVFTSHPMPRVWFPIGMALLLGGLIVFVASSLRYFFASRVEVTNLRALVVVGEGGQAPVTVHGRGLLNPLDVAAGLLVLLMVAVVVMLGNAPAQPEPPPDLPADAVSFDIPFVLCFGITPFAPLVACLFLVLALGVLAPRGRGAVVTVDRDGVSVPHLGLRLPWERVAWVDFAHPSLSTAVGLWIVPHDRHDIVAHAHPPWYRRLPLVAWLLLSRRALYVPVDWMREPPEAIVGAAWRFWRERAASAATPPLG